MTLYQIAETVGMLPDQLRDRLSTADMCEWAVYLNSPFSVRSRDALSNGWLVHTVRSMMADKAHRPKFSDSVFPFEKLAKEFFAKAPPKKAAPGAPRRKTLGEVMHKAQMWRQRYEQALADFRAGKTVNRYGLRYGERMKS